MNMTIRRGGAIGRRFAVVLSLGMAASAGCSSTDPAFAPIGPQAGAMDTGTYPNLNVPPQRAAESMTPEDAAALSAKVGGARSRQAASGRGAGTRGDPQALKRLAAQHGDDALAAIAAQE